MLTNKINTKLILLVETDPTISYILATTLARQLGYEVTVTATRQAAVALLEQNVLSHYPFARCTAATFVPVPAFLPAPPKLPDLILVDLLSLPAREGIIFCYEVRQSQFYQHIPLIVISDGDYAAVEGLRLNYFLPKPFRIAILLEFIEEILARNAIPVTFNRLN